MKKSVSQQLLEYLQANPGVHASGNLQRMEWTNHTGSIATPRSIVRRLQELTEEAKIHCEITKNHAHYSATPIEKPKPRPIYVRINGELVDTATL